ncbi:MAG: DUF1573 domain-containing protein [Desulfuromonadaceae bacterium]|nr:DUF1573 domain-containing protein [Desulfuromonadaceae bacterium]
MMKSRSYTFLWTLLVLFPLALPSSGRAEDAKPAAKISVEAADHDFGKVFSGEKVVHVFKFRNSGNAPLLIERVRQSCGCTATVLSSTSLETGATGEIQSTFNSTGFSGEVVKTIYLYSNAADSPVVQLYLRGTVRQEIVRQPNRVSLDRLIPEKTVSATVKLVHQGVNEISFGAVQVTTPELKAKLSSSRINPGESVTVTLAVTPQPGKRRLGGFVIIPLNGAHLKEIRIPVYAGIVPSAPSQAPVSQP